MRDLRQGNFEGEVNNVELDKENAQGSNMNTIESSRFITHRKRNELPDSHRPNRPFFVCGIEEQSKAT